MAGCNFKIHPHDFGSPSEWPAGGITKHLLSNPMDHPVRLPAAAQELQQGFSSSCNNSERESHLVFLSHAGKQKPFVFDLYNDFLKWPRCPRIDPFFDQSDKSLPKGEEFPDRIFEAARRCAVAVVILTKEYVTSKWPMLELLAFVDAQETTNPHLKLLPVFYDDLLTSPIDDSWIAAWENMRPKSDGTSSVGSNRTTISVKMCKEALRKLKRSNGLVLRNEKSLQSLREEIVKAAVNFLPSSSEMDTENVQGCLRLCESISKMLQKNRRGVYCLGLYGMGGLGKTTMCKELCSYFGPRFFHRVCHVEIGSNDTDPEEKKFKRHIKILESFSDMPEKQISNLDYHKAEKFVHQSLSDTKPKFLAVDNVQDTLASLQEAENYLRWLSPESIIIISCRSRDNLQSVNPDICCNPIPNLNKDEATTLFLKIAAPEVDRKLLDQRHIRIVENCLRICFYSRKKEDGAHTVNGESGHYHPLALRAVAAYFRERYTGPDSILCWKEELKTRNDRFLHAADSIDIFDVLGLGFNDKNMSDLSKQLFIDVALFAPENNIFKWLVSIHYECKPQIIRDKLRLLRKKSFLNYDDGMPSQKGEETCQNISMHELYREFAERYIGSKDEGLFKYGVYDGGDLPPPPLEDPGWATVPRICLQRLTNAAKVKEWCNVAVVLLFGCETISTVSIGELSNLHTLIISRCPMLEVLSWTQDIATKQMWGTKLCVVELSSNKSLRKIPDFSNCSGLEKILVTGCSSSVEPIRFHTCLNLQELFLLGNDVPEVQSIQSCPKLREVQLLWKATHKSLTLLDDLHCLSELRIKGPSEMAFDQMFSNFSSLLGEKQFWKQHPKDNVVFHELPGVGVLTNLQTVNLTCLPLGKLPVKLAAGGSSLRILFLSGCLLSKSVDFSAFPNLHLLSIRWTNVEEVYGLEHLKNLRYLNCNYCFRLRKVPDLRHSSMLKFVSFIQCPKLRSIPRLPPGCSSFSHDAGDVSEDERRAVLATLAFTETTARPLPPPGFGFQDELRSRVIPAQLDGRWAIHVSVTCDGCMAFPIIGRRYRAKPVVTSYYLCSKCFSKPCYCSEGMKPPWKAKGTLQENYDLCSLCYAKSGCDLLDFYEIDETRGPDEGLNPEVTVYPSERLHPDGTPNDPPEGSGVLYTVSVSGVSKPYTDSLSFENLFTLKVKESPFDMTRRTLRFKLVDHESNL